MCRVLEVGEEDRPQKKRVGFGFRKFFRLKIWESKIRFGMVDMARVRIDRKEKWFVVQKF